MMNKLVELRLARNKTRIEVAKELGITPQAYANYERNDRHPNIDMLKKIAKVYGVSVNDVIDGYEMDSEITKTMYPPAMIAFLNNFAKLPEKRRLEYIKRVQEDLDFLKLQ